MSKPYLNSITPDVPTLFSKAGSLSRHFFLPSKTTKILLGSTQDSHSEEEGPEQVKQSG